MELWLRASHDKDVLASMREVLRAKGAVDSDVRAWKWLILALHSAVQGAMVCHLTGTALVGALRTKSIVATLEWFEATRTYPELPEPRQELAEYGVLLDRCVGAVPQSENQGGVIALSSSQLDALKRLHRIRNQFVHFKPQGWSIELSGTAELVGASCAFIREILVGAWAFRHLTQEELAELDHLLDDAIATS